MSGSDHAGLVPQAAAREWLSAFETALGRDDVAGAAACLLPDGHWRDLLSATWRIETASGRAAIEALLRRTRDGFGARAFAVASARTPPRWVH